MPKVKFSPALLGFKRERHPNKNIYLLYEKAKRMGYIVDCNSDKKNYWVAYKKIYNKDGTWITDRMIFQGLIPSNTFAKQLFKNIF